MSKVGGDKVNAQNQSYFCTLAMKDRKLQTKVLKIVSQKAQV